ncbi:MFS general substrate transporter [Lentinus tigrinus ALCF2SS1-6]|uniref:MFS general substrate transporter n=1 Tax=Lentinus tigrinus ALCF2SS1-6 TaxID=1328759 RepID=A0A5C2SCK3_9APHY|nr:MFS general substrate transporter [Lentinus tigrinus ALCF2SS1-6]
MEVELSTMRTRPPHPGLSGEAASVNPTSAASDDTSTRQGRKSMEILENVPTASLHSHPDDVPATAIPALTAASRLKARIQFATLCWTLFLAGWNDGTTGPLLQRIQNVYHVGFALVSMIFIANCIGFITGAVLNVWLTDRFGFGTVRSLAQVAGYVMEAPAPPFPVFVLGYALNGFGVALQDAGANGFVASLKDNAATKMGVLHAVYGAGAFCAPLVATQFSQLSRWSFHFLASLGIAVLNTILMIAVFRFRSQDECLTEIGQPPSHEESSTADNRGSKYQQMFRLRSLHLLALFALLYVGVEVTIGGWIVTYIQRLRGGGPDSGYISSGFFGGLMIGRVGLLWANHMIGERRAVFLYALVAIGLELVVWLVPSLLGGALAVSFVGVLLGPIYPLVMNHAGRVLPPWLLTGSVGWIAGFGQAGSAVFPFMTGALASKAGIKSLQPLLVSMMGFMVFLWALVPNAPRRIE